MFTDFALATNQTKNRIQNSLVFKCLHGEAPPYLARLVKYNKPTRRGLRSEEDTTRLLVPKTSRKKPFLHAHSVY